MHADLSGGKWPKEPMKVLIVDADSKNVQSLAAAFRRQGCDTLEATSFEAAKRLWTAEQPPMLVADIRLGQFNGLQLLLRAKADRPDVVAVITCAIADAVLEAETRRCGGTFLVKPVTPDDVCATLMRSLPVSFFLSGPQQTATLEPIPDRRVAERRQPISSAPVPERRQSDRRKTDH